MTSGATPSFTIDVGSASIAAALIAPLDGRRRLLASAAAPVAVGAEALLRHLVNRVSAADADALAHPAAWPDWPRVECRTVPPPRVALAGVSQRALESLEREFTREGWRVTASVTADRAQAYDAALAIRDPELDLLVVGAPDGTARDAIAQLLAVVGAVASQRPGLPVVLSGGGATAVPGVAPDRTLRGHGPADTVAVSRQAIPGRLAGREAFVRSVASLAQILDLRVEGVDVGHEAATRLMASPDGVLRRIVLADGALVPSAALEDQRLLDAIARWSPLPDDAYVVRDRLRNLRIAPWRDATSDGARLRLAAARAALERLQDAWGDDGRDHAGGVQWPFTDRHGHVPTTAPDLLVASGGAFAAPPGPAVALALVDTLRRPGAVVLAHDHARVLGPIGMLTDEDERRRFLAEIVDAALLPLGSAIVAPGLRAARRGTVRVTVHGVTTTLPLTAGAVQVVDLPPGVSATVELESPDSLFVGARARRVSFEVTGGLGGLLVDTREIPLRLPDRAERRRAYLDAWQRPLWTNAEP